MVERRSFDIAVVGAGIAGASVAAHLAAEARVVLLEMEAHPGYHTTGRSAAVFAPSYGPAPVRALTRASANYFRDDPDGLSQHPLLSPRGALFIAREDQMPSLAQAADDLGGLSQLDTEATCRLQPLLRKDYVAGGLFDPDCFDIDVHALHQGYLRLFRARGGSLLLSAKVSAISRDGDTWRVVTPNETINVATVINAAGAWAGRIGDLAGAEKIGLQPKRRTAMIVDTPGGFRLGTAPLVIDIDENFYLKPDAGRLLISPANEDPDVPSDVQPDELDIAICIDRIERAFDLNVRRIESRWAGLRNFVADKSPVVGFSDRAPGFFWLAGQGGYGIQTAPALAAFAASLITEGAKPEYILAEGLDPASVSIDRIQRD